MKECINILTTPVTSIIKLLLTAVPNTACHLVYSQLPAAAVMLPVVKSSYCCDWFDKMAREPGEMHDADIVYSLYYICSTWAHGRVSGMPIRLPIRTSSMRDMYSIKWGGGSVASLQDTLSCFSWRSCIFGL